ncbi:MAG: hypothetical protein ACYTGZ_05950 [Planctomycetota bacterium]
MDLEAILLWSALAPGVAAGLLLLFGGRRFADFGIGATAAVLIAWLAIHDWKWPAFPPPESSAALPLPILAAGLVTLFPNRWLRRGLGLLPALLVAYYVMSTQKTTAGAWTGAAIVLAWSLGAEALATKREGWEIPAAWLLAFAIAVLAFERAGSVFAMRTAGGLAAACGAFAILGGFRRLSSAGAALPLGVAYYGLLANTHLFADDFPMSAAVLLGVAPLAAWVGEGPFFAQRPTWQRAGARLLAVAIVAGIGLGIAAAHAPDAEPEGDNPYSDYSDYGGG